MLSVIQSSTIKTIATFLLIDIPAALLKQTSIKLYKNIVTFPLIDTATIWFEEVLGLLATIFRLNYFRLEHHSNSNTTLTPSGNNNAQQPPHKLSCTKGGRVVS